MIALLQTQLVYLHDGSQLQCRDHCKVPTLYSQNRRLHATSGLITAKQHDTDTSINILQAKGLKVII